MMIKNALSEIHWQWPHFDLEITLSKEAINTFHVNRQTNGRNECGGLIFLDLKNNDNISISYVSKPSIIDLAGRSWLEINPVRYQKELKRANKRNIHFAGFWHTHPQFIPEISNQDKISFINYLYQFKERKSLICIIVGTSLKKDGIKAWILRENIFSLGNVL